ncbi:reverse transcriptase domain-containing protein [uncultured Kordia sp.]|uniref:reverse transcriptase domain-containing protein n=1 Tax=uncultured Kordia sp. TaxID=507699 RepID=UPI0026201E4E|nr:reverse transcriptase domain-containing protein [uncultured Kordia sp.]
MKEFSTYFTERAIVTHICKIRVKIAKTRNKKHLIHLLTDSKKYNYHIKERDPFNENDFTKYQFELNKQLSKILPPRKKWIKLGYKSRMNRNGTEKLTSNDKNFYSLLKTIKLYRKKEPTASWLIELDSFIKEIQQAIKNDNFQIKPPLIFPKLKEDTISKTDINKCRPISMFSLKERIILSITNKYLTHLFDGYFQDSSYAFRAKRNEQGNIISHHDCIKDVIKLKEENTNEPLYVVECDMEKFYDSVNHKIVRGLFNKLIQKSKKDSPKINFKVIKNIFNEYLNCYAFNKNVPLSNDIEYWTSYNIPNGEFGWVKKRLKELNYYSNIDQERIGVPQGGALSGLIANIVLNEADKKVLKTEVFYIRFCDDMLILHKDKNKCDDAKNIYIKSLEELKLVPHKFENNLVKRLKKSSRNTTEPFWYSKSKGSYKWDSIKNGGFPWIGFVGYELHHKGNIRVRKKSLEKELKKQQKIVNEIENAIKLGQRKVKSYVVESAINRLIGMSVGRIGLNNFEEASSDMCWKNGFKELKLNDDSKRQIKQLDRNRSKLYYDLLKSVKSPEKDDKDSEDKKRKRQIIFYDKPFSYYYQVLERSEQNTND